jgi:hypothetical protein
MRIDAITLTTNPVIRILFILNLNYKCSSNILQWMRIVIFIS